MTILARVQRRYALAYQRYLDAQSMRADCQPRQMAFAWLMIWTDKLHETRKCSVEAVAHV